MTLSNKPSARLIRRATAYARLAAKAIIRGNTVQAEIYQNTRQSLIKQAAIERKAGR